MDPIEVLDQRRFAYLYRLYEESSGDEQHILDAGSIRDALGFTQEQASDAIRYLDREKLADFSLGGAPSGLIKLTKAGVREVERAIRLPRESTGHFPPQIINQTINIHSAPNATIVQAGATANVEVNQSFAQSQLL